MRATVMGGRWPSSTTSICMDTHTLVNLAYDHALVIRDLRIACDLSRGGCPSVVAVITGGGFGGHGDWLSHQPLSAQRHVCGLCVRSSMVDCLGSVEPCPVGL